MLLNDLTTVLNIKEKVQPTDSSLKHYTIDDQLITKIYIYKLVWLYTEWDAMDLLFYFMWLSSKMGCTKKLVSPSHILGSQN